MQLEMNNHPQSEFARFVIRISDQHITLIWHESRMDLHASHFKSTWSHCGSSTGPYPSENFPKLEKKGGIWRFSTFWTLQFASLVLEKN